MSNHKLYLGLYSFQIRTKSGKRMQRKVIPINDFLNKIEDGINSGFAVFYKKVIETFNAKTIKTKDDTQGGALAEHSCEIEDRTVDILINAGNTGIQQFLIDEDGESETISPNKIIGLKFYIRIWLPAGGDTGYVFIQHYNTLRITKLAEYIIKSVLEEYEYYINSKGLVSTTTKVRKKLFMQSSTLKNITIICKKSKNEISQGNAKSVSIKLNSLNDLIDNIFKLDEKAIKKALEQYGITLSSRSKYDFKATYKNDEYDNCERTTTLDDSDENINIIPPVIIPPICICSNGYPIFERMKKFTDDEIKVIESEISIP